MGFETHANKYYHELQRPTFPDGCEFGYPTGHYHGLSILYHHGHRYGYHITNTLHMPINGYHDCHLFYVGISVL